jgi:AcrR family transcriptional regulator
VGNREKLVAGARRCLYEKGYVRTTARDIASAAGTSLAAIGYHFGSKEALLTTALIQATDEWGTELERVLAREVEPGDDPVHRFELTWTRIIDSFGTHRELWATQFKILTEFDELPSGPEGLIEALRQARQELAALFGYHDGAGDAHALAIGSFLQALLTGVLAQWLTDPEHAASGSDLAYALRRLVAGVDRPGART